MQLVLCGSSQAGMLLKADLFWNQTVTLTHLLVCKHNKISGNKQYQFNSHSFSKDSQYQILISVNMITYNIAATVLGDVGNGIGMV